MDHRPAAAGRHRQRRALPASDWIAADGMMPSEKFRGIRRAADRRRESSPDGRVPGLPNYVTPTKHRIAKKLSASGNQGSSPGPVVGAMEFAQRGRAAERFWVVTNGAAVGEQAPRLPACRRRFRSVHRSICHALLESKVIAEHFLNQLLQKVGWSRRRGLGSFSGTRMAGSCGSTGGPSRWRSSGCSCSVRPGSCWS